MTFWNCQKCGKQNTEQLEEKKSTLFVRHVLED